MENLNAENVKSDLAICALGDCQACHYNKFIAGCRDELCGDALALINSQEQRIKELAEENERLREEKVVALRSTIENAKANAKADTVRKMQERLKEAPIKVGLPLFGLQTKDEVEDYANELILQMRDAIDQIAKEILEGEK
jgi:hypothetical protein